MSFNSMKNGPSREELQKELTLAQSVGDREKASSLVKQLREIDDPTESNNRKKLESELAGAQSRWERDKAQNLIDQLKNLDTPKANKVVDEFEDKLKEIQEKLKDKKLKPKDLKAELEKFLSKDIRDYQGNIESNTKLMQDSKQAEVDRLRKQLSWAMSEDFSLKEYFSPERVRLAKLRKTFESLKNDTAKYPKNVLIYAMSFTKWLLWVKQGAKRWRYKMALRWNSNKIWEKIKKLETDLQPKTNDTERRKFTKQLILEQVKDAKVHYLNQVQRDIWLAA